MSDSDSVTNQFENLDMETENDEVDRVMKEIQEEPKESVNETSTSSSHTLPPIVTYPGAKSRIPRKQTPRYQSAAEHHLAQVCEDAPPRYQSPLVPPIHTESQLVHVPNTSTTISTTQAPTPRRQGRVAKRSHNRSRNSQFRIQRHHYASIGDAIFNLARQEFLGRRPGHRRGFSRRSSQ